MQLNMSGHSIDDSGKEFYYLCQRLLYLTQLLQLYEYLRITYYKFEILSK
jgi:hypothetical protein